MLKLTLRMGSSWQGWGWQSHVLRTCHERYWDCTYRASSDGIDSRYKKSSCRLSQRISSIRLALEGWQGGTISQVCQEKSIHIGIWVGTSKIRGRGAKHRFDCPNAQHRCTVTFDMQSQTSTQARVQSMESSVFWEASRRGTRSNKCIDGVHREHDETFE